MKINLYNLNKYYPEFKEIFKSSSKHSNLLQFNYISNIFTSTKEIICDMSADERFKESYNNISSSFISSLIELIFLINSSSISSLNKIILKARYKGFKYISNIPFIELEQLFTKSNCKWNIKQQKGKTQDYEGSWCDCAELIIFRV